MRIGLRVPPCVPLPELVAFVQEHPSVVAGAARTVAELAPRRFVLGVGVGNSSVVPAGLTQPIRANLRAGLKVIRSLPAGDEVDFGGVRSRLRNPVAVGFTQLACAVICYRRAAKLDLLTHDNPK